MKSQILSFKRKGEPDENIFRIEDKGKIVCLIEEGEAGLHISIPEKGNFGSGHVDSVYIESEWVQDIIQLLKVYEKCGTITETVELDYEEENLDE